MKISNPNQTVNIDKTKQTKKRTAMVQNEKKTPNHKRFDIGKTLSSKGGGVLSISLCSISPPISHIFTSRIHSALEIKSITRPTNIKAVESYLSDVWYVTDIQHRHGVIQSKKCNLTLPEP